MSILRSKRVQPSKRFPQDNPAKICRPHLPSPKTLVELCGDVLDAMPLPRCWKWSVEEVASWLDSTVGLPQYQEAFRMNNITGRKLLLVDASGLVRMNIHDFDHIKQLTAGIRKLGGMTRERQHRRLSEPPFDPETFFILYRAYHKISRMEFFYGTNLVQRPRPIPNHWETIEPCFPKYPPDQYRVTLPFKKHKNDWARKQTKCVQVKF
ncbi:Sterile alpha motif domain-containing protein 15 [Gryllus bimaculatus]|nr:Sterile alpha motif domain-containing protein 15 [Gryllus bimaculatus]